MNTKVLHGNPVTREKTMEASLTSKFTSLDSTLARATTPYNLLKGEHKLLFIQFDFPVPIGRGSNSYKPTV